MKSPVNSLTKRILAITNTVTLAHKKTGFLLKYMNIFANMNVQKDTQPTACSSSLHIDEEVHNEGYACFQQNGYTFNIDFPHLGFFLWKLEEGSTQAAQVGIIN